MHRLPTCLLAGAIAVSVAMPIHAQTQKEIRDMVAGLYIVSIAIDACDLDLTKEQEQRLDYWTEWGEKKLNIADRKLDKAYSTLEEAVEKDKSSFCKEMSPVAKQVLKDLPPAN